MITRVMLGSGCNPVDLQALHIDEDRQGLAVKSFPLCRPTEQQSGSRGFVITGAFTWHTSVQ